MVQSIDTTATQRPLGVHEWLDQHGNYGTEIVSQRQIKVHTSRVNGLFDSSKGKTEAGLAGYFNREGGARRKLLVVVDGSLSESKRDQIRSYFDWCKSEKILQDFSFLSLDVTPEEKTLVDCASTVLKAAGHAKLKRRDLYVGVGSSAVTDVVGFAAALYRRSTPWIMVPTDLLGIIRCSSTQNKLSLNHISDDGVAHKGIFSMNHPPVAAFYDTSSLETLHQAHMRCGMAEMVRLAVHRDGELFSYLDAHLQKMFSDTREGASCLMTAVGLASRDAAKELSEAPHANVARPSIVDVGSEVARTVEKAGGKTYDDAEATSTGLALTAALLFQKGYLSLADVDRVLKLLEKAELQTFDDALDAHAIWERLVGTSQKQGGAPTFIAPSVLGKREALSVSELSVGDIHSALSILRKHSSEKTCGSPTWKITSTTLEGTGVGTDIQNCSHDQTATQEQQYHVITVPEIFNPNNTTIVDEYCVDKTTGRKRKVLVVVDDYEGSKIDMIDAYFKKHSSSVAEYSILPMHVSSSGKDTDSTLRVIDAAISLNMSQRDVFMVAGGGTLMDIVGFAAVMYQGGTPYVRIPTTLVGMIDAGIGAKVGVNFGNHKNLIGSYFSPAACLNDPGTFLDTLPRREFACGLAESIKMALIKSERLFDVIGKYHRTGGVNEYTDELIHISIRTMLEELQPNLWETSLLRLVDFGHEFGHIVEARAHHEIPHGECVSMGMAISTHLAHMRGVIPRAELDRVLDCLLSLGLPIHATEHDCCNADVLWAKISTEGIEHKDGKLWLAIPAKIGTGGFIDEITDISAEMVAETMSSLREYQNQYRGAASGSAGSSRTASTQVSRTASAQSSRTASQKSSRATSPDNTLNSKRVAFPEKVVVDISTQPASKYVPTPEKNAKMSLTNGKGKLSTASKGSHQPGNKPHVIVVDVGATYFRVGVVGQDGLVDEPARIPSPSRHTNPNDSLAALQERLLETLASEIENVRTSHTELSLGDVGISFGAVVTREGVVADASVLWNESARGYDFKKALQERLPGINLTILNDISAAAWRYKDEGRYCLITVSSGLSNKVFNPELRVLDRLDLDHAGVGGEMGHVVAEPRAVDTAVQAAILKAFTHPEDFKRSKLSAHVDGDAEKINARHLGLAYKADDQFTVRLLEEAGVPCCPCGNVADLCSYSSGRGALRLAKRLAAKSDFGIAVEDVTDRWLADGIEKGQPLARQVLREATFPLALRVLQLAADIGLDKFIIVGGFAMKTGKNHYLKALQDHLVRLYHQSAFYGDWDEAKVRNLVQFGVNDDSDGLIGMGNYVQHVRSQYHAVEKAIGESSLSLVTRPIPRCGAQEILTKVMFSGICTTDLQILRGQNGMEPTVLGHEGICQVIEVGKTVKGVEVGDMIVLNPNNPLDDHDKLGHIREGVLQEYFKFGKEFLERGQVLNLGKSAASATDTLTEPLSTVVAAQERLTKELKRDLSQKNVLVIGAGTMGLLFVTLNTKMGARNVFLANRTQGRVDFAVEKGIISKENTIVLGDNDTAAVAAQVEKVTRGEGVDIVVSCVPHGQGTRVGNDAATYVKDGGVVYCFSGFVSGDALTLDGGEKVDVWPIRSGWKSERRQYAGKSVDFTGHRGSRVKHMDMASEIIRKDGLAFGKVISHIVSNDALPDIMMELAQKRTVHGVPALRVIVDMNARDRVVESTAELPLRHLHEAARKEKNDISMGNFFREIGFDGNASMLGWAVPPAWLEVKASIEQAMQRKPLVGKRHFIWVGTGPWAFLVDALKESMPASSEVVFHTLQSLDPQALAELFKQIGDLTSAVCLGVSQSGTTMETVMLVNAVRERFDTAGLDYRNHFIWLTETSSKAHRDSNSGEAVIRSLKEHDWEHVEMVPLTVGNHPDINALFCAPHSMLLLLPMALMLRSNTEAMDNIYHQYLSMRDAVDHSILAKAHSVALHGTDQLQLNLDKSITSSVARLATQVFEQGLGSKQSGFNPRILIASGGKTAGFESVEVQVPEEAPSVVKMMLTLNALSVFVAMVAYHKRIEFVTHPAVNRYKKRTKELLASKFVIDRKASESDEITAEVAEYLESNPETRFVEALCYGHVPGSHREGVKKWLSPTVDARSPNVSLDIVQGEKWNHSRYPAAVSRKDTVYVVMAMEKYRDQVEGISKETLDANTKTLDAIALSTYETLLPRSLYFRTKKQ